MITVLKIAAFLRRHYPPCRLWPKERFIPWLVWLWKIDAIFCVTNNGRLTGVGIARVVNSIQQGKDKYALDENGTIFWVDLGVALNTQATALLFKQGRERWGERLFVGFHRRKMARHDVLPWREFMNHFKSKEISYGR